MGTPVIDASAMTVDEFYAYTDARPDHEKWELIGGKPILNAAPSRRHQRIAINIVVALRNRQRDLAASWEVLTDFGLLVSDTSRPEPDVVALPYSLGNDRHADDVIVAFEVLSPSTKTRDLTVKRDAYISLASLTHYVVIAQDKVEVIVFARDNGFKKSTFRSRDDVVDLGSLSVLLPVAEIYRDTGV